MRSDSDIQKDITAELKWDPSLRNDAIAVAVRDGVVTLAGYVESYTGKWRAERLASQRPQGCVGGLPVRESIVHGDRVGQHQPLAFLAFPRDGRAAAREVEAPPFLQLALRSR